MLLRCDVGSVTGVIRLALLLLLLLLFTPPLPLFAETTVAGSETGRRNVLLGNLSTSVLGGCGFISDTIDCCVVVHFLLAPCTVVVAMGDRLTC